MPENHAGGIDVNLLGGTGHIVGTTRVGIAIRHHGFLFSEVGNGSSQLLHHGKVGTEGTGFDVHSLDFIIVARGLDGIEHLVEPLLLQHFIAEQFGKRIVDGSFVDNTGQRQAQHTSILNNRLLFSGGGYRKQHHQTHHHGKHAHDDHGQHCGKHVLEKIFHILLFYIVRKEIIVAFVQRSSTTSTGQWSEPKTSL